MTLIKGSLCGICSEFFPEDKLEEAQKHAEIPLNRPYPIGLLLRGKEITFFSGEQDILFLFNRIVCYDSRHDARYFLRSFDPADKYRTSASRIHPFIDCFDAMSEGAPLKYIDEQIKEHRWTGLAEEEFELHSRAVLRELAKSRNNEKFYCRGKPRKVPALIRTHEGIYVPEIVRV